MADFGFWYTGTILVVLTFVLIKEYIEADIAVFSSALLLVMGGVIDVREAFSGFSNHGMLTVGLLFVVAAALQKTGMLNRLSEILMGTGKSTSGNLLRILPAVSVLSGFFNNTPIVAMLIPVIRKWALKHNLSPSRFLIPLSYATILGGTCTLIGTSTNLVVHGLMIDNGIPGMGFFEIARVGIPVTVVGLVLLIFIVHRWLPDRVQPMADLGKRTREFVVGMKVVDGYPHVGKTIRDAGLRSLKGLFLFQIERMGQLRSPVGPDEMIQMNDRLFFTGLPDTILELQRTPGLSLLKDPGFDLKNYDSDDLRTFEVVVSQDSPLVGKNIRESEFRGVYHAVIIAVHRSGERIRQKVGDIVIHPGDTLLILAKHDFMTQWYHTRDFYLVSRSVEVPSKPMWISLSSLVILALMIISMATGLLPVLVSVALATVLLILLGSISPHDARHSVDWKVLLIIASSLGISRAMDNSGVAHFLAHQLLTSLGFLGLPGILAGIYFLTSFYTEIITNNAAAALLVPVAISAGEQAGLDPRGLLIAVAMAASASFATPIGYQTNLMVYGPGGYKFKDFLRVGIPMNVIVGIVAIIMIYLWYYI